jgi:tRNA(Ile)-lysidine synthetase-like protein
MEKVYDFWFDERNKNLWFNSTLEDDLLITELFDYLFEFNIDILELKINKKYALGAIILYDQITRHKMRAQTSNFELILTCEQQENFIKITNQIALILQKKVYSIYKNLLNAEEFAFVMLPLRHSNDFENIKYVMSETWEKIELCEDEIEIQNYKKFIKATYERAIKQSTDIKEIKIYLERKEIDEEKEFNEDNFLLEIAKIADKYRHILDEKCFDEIKEICTYLDIKQLNLKCIKKLRSLRKDNYILSISGGVDSLVCSFILKKHNINFKCVHINYNNRKESIDEENFVIEWCKLLNIDLYVRRIEEINRNQCMKHNLRELYENYTRDVRYNTYLKTEINNIILGHNQDDCFENIITNITSRTKYENLHGMELQTTIKFMNSDINFIRPMLEISKKNIYDYAKYYNFLFLWDSTPKWSQRGKIRDNVRPALENFNIETIGGIFEISTILSQSFEMAESLVKNWIERIIDNYIICSIKELPKNKMFWKEFLKEKNINISNKTLDNLISFIIRIKENKKDINSFMICELNKFIQIKVKILKNEQIQLFIQEK